MLLVDYEKDHDRVEWGSIKMMMESLGLPNRFCHMVSTLLVNARAIVVVNGKVLNSSTSLDPLGRAVHLALHSVLIADSLHYLLWDKLPISKGCRSLPS